MSWLQTGEKVWGGCLRPMIIKVWQAELESHILGHVIAIILPINDVCIIVTWLPFIHCDETNRSSWLRKWKTTTNLEQSNQSKNKNRHGNIWNVFLLMGNSQWCLYNTQIGCSTLSQEYCKLIGFQLEINEKATFNINMPYRSEVVTHSGWLDRW